jgi:hypothetical protein
MSERKLVIVFALFPGLTQLSLTGPYEVLTKSPDAKAIVASVAGGALESSMLAFVGLRRLADIGSCDVICVPGGSGVFDHAMHYEIFPGELRRLAANARRSRSSSRSIMRRRHHSMRALQKPRRHRLWRSCVSATRRSPAAAGRLSRLRPAAWL